MPTKPKPRRRVWPFLVLTALGVVAMCGVEAATVLFGFPGETGLDDGPSHSSWSEPNAQGVLWHGRWIGANSTCELLLGNALGRADVPPPRVERSSVEGSIEDLREVGPMPRWSILGEPPGPSIEPGVHVIEIASGWPVRLWVFREFAVEVATGPKAGTWIKTSERGVLWRNLPGFLLLAAGVSAAGCLGLKRASAWGRRRARLRNVCEHCGYDLSGLGRGDANVKCPECGEHAG